MQIAAQEPTTQETTIKDMQLRSPKKVFLFFVFFAFLGIELSSTRSWAYIPPSSFLIKSWVRKHGHIQAVRIKSKVSAGGSSAGSSAGFNPEGVAGSTTHDPANKSASFKVISYYDFRSDVLTNWIVDDKWKKLEKIERLSPSKARGGSVGTPITPAAAILFEARAFELSSLLKQNGIPVELDLTAQNGEPADPTAPAPQETEFLGRWLGTIAWVIGSKNKPESQLWLEKDTFLPLCLRAKSYEIRFETYRYSGDMPFPRVISVFNLPEHLHGISTGVPPISHEKPYREKPHEDTPLLREEIQDVTTNFNLNEIQGPPGLKSSGNTEFSQNIQTLINLYFRTLR